MEHLKNLTTVDTVVAQRIRAFRNALEMSEETVASELGVPCSVYKKYENGKCIVEASTLWEIARVLHVKVDAFFPVSVAS
jgi:transcriptional regulator with XRE-family HTH domain